MLQVVQFIIELLTSPLRKSDTDSDENGSNKVSDSTTSVKSFIRNRTSLTDVDITDGTLQEKPPLYVGYTNSSYHA